MAAERRCQIPESNNKEEEYRTDGPAVLCRHARCIDTQHRPPPASKHHHSVRSSDVASDYRPTMQRVNVRLKRTQHAELLRHFRNESTFRMTGEHKELTCCDLGREKSLGNSRTSLLNRTKL